MNMHPRDLALIIFCCLVWGFAFTAGKAGVDEFPPVLFTGLRYVLLAALLFPFLRIHRGQMGMLMAAALTTGALHVVFFYSGLALSGNVSLVALAAQMEVPFTTFLAIILLAERVGWRRMMGFFFCVAGMVILSFDPAMLNYSGGVVLVLISAFAGALGTIFLRRLRNVPLLDLMAWTAFTSFPILLMTSLVFESGHLEAMTQASWAGWGGIIYSALCAHFLAGGIFYYLLQRYDVSLLSTLTSLAPVFAVIFGVALHGDALTQEIIFGGLTILIGTIVIIEREKTRRRRIIRA